jgi:signal transduction histidine kinase
MARVMAATELRASPSQDVMRDPVWLLPAVVSAGLAVAWLGIHEHVSGARITVDVALSWSLVAASLVALERPRWRRARFLLAATGFAVLGEDLEWATSHAVWKLGLLLEGAWVALLVQFCVTFPEGRRWSRFATAAIVGAYAATVFGQLVGVASSDSEAHAIDRAQALVGTTVAVIVLFLLAQRFGVLRHPARRAQAPVFVAATITCLAASVWVSWVAASGSGKTTLETICRAVAVTIPIGVIAGVIWSRLRQPELSDLVVELPSKRTAGMRERLAKTLGDPTLDVAYRLGDGRYVDATGQPIALPQRDDRAVTPVTAGGEEVAALVHDPALLDEPALVESVRATAALVLENERLAAEVRSQLSEVRASRGRIVAAGDAERRRIERNLHDGAQQRLVTLSLALGLEAARADAATADTLSRAQAEVELAIAELRELARGIHPTLLRDQGLEAAVAALARRTPLPVTVQGTAGGRLPDPVELAGYFVVAEALTNVVRHASATEAVVLLERDSGALRITLSDDGVGGAHLLADSGLAGLRDRLEALDATLTIESEPARGTIIRASIPCAS